MPACDLNALRIEQGATHGCWTDVRFPHGFGAARPYLHDYPDQSDFVKHVFGAVEIERVEMGPKSFHVECQIGDSIVVLEAGDPPHPSATLASVYVYVEDVDAAYRRALEFGATSIAEPEDKP